MGNGRKVYEIQSQKNMEHIFVLFCLLLSSTKLSVGYSSMDGEFRTKIETLRKQLPQESEPITMATDEGVEETSQMPPTDSAAEPMPQSTPQSEAQSTPQSTPQTASPSMPQSTTQSAAPSIPQSTPSEESGAAQSMPPSTPQMTDNIKNDKINQKISLILDTSRVGQFIGNKEFDQQTDYLRHIATLDANSLQLKIQAYHRFLSYNYLRLELEGNLLSRIAVIESKLFDKQLSKRCQAYYRNARIQLKEALKEHNSLKSYKLNLYSADCPQNYSNGLWNNEDYFWGGWYNDFDYFSNQLKSENKSPGEGEK